VIFASEVVRNERSLLVGKISFTIRLVVLMSYKLSVSGSFLMGDNFIITLKISTTISPESYTIYGETPMAKVQLRPCARSGDIVFVCFEGNCLHGKQNGHPEILDLKSDGPCLGDGCYWFRHQDRVTLNVVNKQVTPVEVVEKLETAPV